MSVTGSFATFLTDRSSGLHALVRETTKDGLGALQSSIKELTPVDTGHLRKSIETSRAKRIGALTYTGSVSTEVLYAKFVEYGTAPHIINPNERAALEFTGVVAETVRHPGAKAAHMFQLGTAEFKVAKLDAIMKKNLALYLAGGEAALAVT